MRNLIFILIASVFMASCATYYPFATAFPDPEIDKIVDTKLTRNDAYTLANEWMVEKFVSATDVIQYSDKEAGIIKGKFTLHTLSRHYSGSLVYKEKIEGLVTVRVKDNKAKITIVVTPIVEVGIDNNKWSEIALKTAKSIVVNLISSFETTMTTTTDVDEDW